MKKRSINFAIYFSLVLVSFTLLGGCGKKETKQVKERVANVRVQPAEKKPLRPFLDAVGTLKALEEVTVSSELDGIIRNLKVDDGTVVRRGDALVTIADREYELEVNRSAAALKQAEASCDNIKLEFQRKESLYKEELVTKQQFEDVSTRLSLAQSECDRAKAGLSLAQEKFAKTMVASPLQGIIKEKKISLGDYVKNGTALFSVIHTDTLKLNFSVTEQDAGKIKIGQDVIFQVDSAPDKSYRGRVKTIYPHLEEKTRTLMVEALVPNGDHSLKPGFFARVKLYLGPAREGIVIPVNSLLYDEAKTKVFVVEGNVAHSREVKIGAKYGDLLEITEGIKEKEAVVSVGQNNLAEGVKVNVAR